jgi:hypothetical protein
MERPLVWKPSASGLSEAKLQAARPASPPPLPKTSPVIDQWIKDPQIPDQQREEI